MPLKWKLIKPLLNPSWIGVLQHGNTLKRLRTEKEGQQAAGTAVFQGRSHWMRAKFGTVTDAALDQSDKLVTMETLLLW